MADERTTRGLARWVIYVMMAVLPFAFTTASANACEIKNTIVSLAGVAVVALLVLHVQSEGGVSYLHTRLDLPAAAYLGWNLLRALTARYHYATVPYVLRMIVCVALYFAVTHCMTKRLHVKRLTIVFMLASIAPCIYGFMQHFRIDPIVWMPSSFERVLASFGNPTYFAAYLTFTIPLAVCCFMSETRRDLSGVWLAVIPLQHICLLWTYSRGPWLGLLVALVVGLGMPLLQRDRGYLRTHKARLASVLGMLLLITVVLSHKGGVVERAASSVNVQDASNVQRTLQWKAACRVFLEHPILGVGPGTLRIYMAEKLTPAFFRTGIETVSEHAHNESIEVAADTGIVGFALFLWILVAALSMTVRMIRHPDPNNEWRSLNAAALLGEIGGLLICNLVGVSMRYSVGAVYFWIYLGLLGAICAETFDMDEEKQYRWVALRIPTVSKLKLVRFGAIGVAVAVWFSVRPFLAGMAEKEANAYLSDGRAAEAQSAIVKCLELSPCNVTLLYRLASVQNATGQYDEALRTYERITNLSPDYGRIHYNLGALYLNLGRPGPAVEELERAAGLDGLPDTWALLSQAYRASGNEPKAAFASAKSLEGSSCQYWREQLELAEQLLALGKPKVASELLRKVLQDNPDESRARLALGLAYEKLGRTDQAADQYELVLRAEPDNAIANTNLGCIYFRSGRLGDARRLFEQVPGTGRDTAVALNLGMVYWKLGENDRVLRMCESVLKTEPDSAAADRARAVIYRITGEKRL